MITVPALQASPELALGRRAVAQWERLDSMTKADTRATVAWRWTLITAELLLAGYMAFALWAGRAARYPTGQLDVVDRRLRCLGIPLSWESVFGAIAGMVGDSRLVHRGRYTLSGDFTMLVLLPNNLSSPRRQLTK